MKISHVKSKLEIPRVIDSSNKSEFKDINQLTGISYLIKKYYDPMNCNCDIITKVLSNMYNNLFAVPVDILIFDGAIQRGGHKVLKVKDGNMLIDPTGDYTSYTDPIRLNRDITPWLYVKYPDSDMYVSQNHMPFANPHDEGADKMDEWDILRLSGGPFYKGLRAIIL